MLTGGDAGRQRLESRRVVLTGRDTGDVASTLRAAEVLTFEAFFEGRWEEAEALLAESLPALRAERLPAGHRQSRQSRSVGAVTRR